MFAAKNVSYYSVGVLPKTSLNKLNERDDCYYRCVIAGDVVYVSTSGSYFTYQVDNCPQTSQSYNDTWNSHIFPCLNTGPGSLWESEKGK